MIHPYKGRSVELGQRVKAYRNLHRAMWSLVAADGLDKGLVIAHASELGLFDCEFHVSQSGRERVIREGRKNVHAFIEGNITASAPQHYVRTRITYNPFKQTGFELDGHPGSNLILCHLVHLDRFGKAWSVHLLDLGNPRYGR